MAHGFLSTAREVTPAEVDLMADAPPIIALELGLRFLTDYLRGNSYFKRSPADPPDPNRVRAMAQLALFCRLRENADEARRFIEDLRMEVLATPSQTSPPRSAEQEPHRGSPSVGTGEA